MRYRRLNLSHPTLHAAGPTAVQPGNPERRKVLGLALRLPTYMGAGVGLGASLGTLSGCFWDAQASVPDLPFTQLDGSQHRLTDLKGKVALINFWATSCTTCVKEMPKIVSTFEKFRSQGFETLSIAMAYDAPAYVMQFAQSRKLPFRVVMDHDGKLAQAFGPVQLTPTSFVINKKGEIVKRYVGEPDFAALHALIQQLLTEA
jgi:peroxiredoxin